MFALKYLRAKQNDRKRRIQDEKEWKEAGKEGERSKESEGGKESLGDHQSESEGEETVRSFCSPKQCFQRLRRKRAGIKFKVCSFPLKFPERNLI
jgi:hypothetical protein